MKIKAKKTFLKNNSTGKMYVYVSWKFTELKIHIKELKKFTLKCAPRTEMDTVPTFVAAPFSPIAISFAFFVLWNLFHHIITFSEIFNV